MFPGHQGAIIEAVKASALSILMALALAPAASPQAATFDIATFTPPGGAAQRRERNRTNAYFGNGAYTINGSTITLTRDANRGRPTRGHFRVEQVSKDGGATWIDRLCLLLEGISGEVCYTRDQTP